MPNIGSIGWVNIKGAMSPNVIQNATNIVVATTIPEDHNSLLYGPITIGANTEFKIEPGAQVKIKDFDNI